MRGVAVESKVGVWASGGEEEVARDHKISSGSYSAAGGRAMAMRLEDLHERRESAQPPPSVSRHQEVVVRFGFHGGGRWGGHGFVGSDSDRWIRGGKRETLAPALPAAAVARRGCLAPHRRCSRRRPAAALW